MSLPCVDDGMGPTVWAWAEMVYSLERELAKTSDPARRADIEQRLARYRERVRIGIIEAEGGEAS